VENPRTEHMHRESISPFDARDRFAPAINLRPRWVAQCGVAPRQQARGDHLFLACRAAPESLAELEQVRDGDVSVLLQPVRNDSQQLGFSQAEDLMGDAPGGQPLLHRDLFGDRSHLPRQQPAFKLGVERLRAVCVRHTRMVAHVRHVRKRLRAPS